MSNLIERLRTERSVYDAELADEAADEIERLRGVVDDAIKAINSLDDDALGFGQSADGHGDVYRWHLKEELLSNLRAALDERKY